MTENQIVDALVPWAEKKWHSLVIVNAPREHWVAGFWIVLAGSVSLGITISGGTCSGSSSKSVPIQAPPAVAITGPSSTCPNVARSRCALRARPRS